MKQSFCLTREINERCADDFKFSKFILESVKRHFAQDWSDCSKEDQEQNKASIKNGDRIFSVYDYSDSEKIWIITEAKPYRDITTVLFPHEY